jgi:hypothetical protein
MSVYDGQRPHSLGDAWEGSVRGAYHVTSAQSAGFRLVYRRLTFARTPSNRPATASEPNRDVSVNGGTPENTNRHGGQYRTAEAPSSRSGAARSASRVRGGDLHRKLQHVAAVNPGLSALRLADTCGIRGSDCDKRAWIRSALELGWLTGRMHRLYASTDTAPTGTFPCFCPRPAVSVEA